MRDVHPDAAAASAASMSADGADGVDGDAYYADTTDLAVILNEIYETLTDPEQRATYDAIAGFSASAADPFGRDAASTFERDRVFVDEVSCIGCGKCVRACPSAFVIEGSKYGRARVVRQPTVRVFESCFLPFCFCPLVAIWGISQVFVLPLAGSPSPLCFTNPFSFLTHTHTHAFVSRPPTSRRTFRSQWRPAQSTPFTGEDLFFFANAIREGGEPVVVVVGCVVC